MRLMIIVKATKDSEAGVMPEEKLVPAMATYHEELAKAGALLDASGLQASAKGRRVKYAGEKRSVMMQMKKIDIDELTGLCWIAIGTVRRSVSSRTAAIHDTRGGTYEIHVARVPQ